MNLQVKIQPLLDKLAAIKAQSDPKQWLAAVGNALIRWVNDNFKNQGTEEKWKPLSPNTMANRRGGGAGAQALMDTGRLRMSFTQASGNPRIIGDTVSVTSNMEYAPYHEFGTGPFTIRKNGPGVLAFKTAGGMVFAKEVHHPGIPRRPMLPSEGVARSLTIETLTNVLKKALATAQRAAGA